MFVMHCNFTKNQAFSLAFRVSSRPTGCLKPLHSPKFQSLFVGSRPKLLECPFSVKSRCFSSVNYGDTRENFHLLKRRNNSIGLCHKTLGREVFGNLEKLRNFCGRFCLKLVFHNNRSMSSRSASRLYSHMSIEGSDNVDSAGRALPWLAVPKVRSARRSENLVTNKTNPSSWEESAEKFLKNGASSTENKKTRLFEHLQKNCTVNDESFEEEGEIRGGDTPRWYKVKSKFNGMVDVKPGSDRPEFRNWQRQENWGRKTMKEATESKVPKFIGEGVYGVGPVLASLLAGRREFYALYVQEGLDFSSNNRKKKDKKGFEKVLKIAEKIGLSKKEVSKHDLNMVVDNRPHQGLVLDASPLEMVDIRELDPVSIDGKNDPLWVALDEVTDPQNLGAIIRSAYFFGASGVVLCAKNSAPLSGVVSKASAGSLELMELRSCRNMMQFLTASSDNGWRVLGGSVSSEAAPLNEVLPGVPTILVLGSEGTGLRPLVERSCTQLISIRGNIHVDVSSVGNEDMGTADMDNARSGQEFQSFMAVESLNVSVAAGVLLHHLTGTSYSSSGQ